jgi:hypothetical protein
LLIATVACVLAVRHPRSTRRPLLRAVAIAAPAVIVVELLTAAHVLLEGRYLLALWLPVGLAVTYGLTSPAAVRLGTALAVVLVGAWIAAGVVGHTSPRFSNQDDVLHAAQGLGLAAGSRLIAINQPWDVVPFEAYRTQSSPATHRVVRVRELDVVAMPANGEPFPAEHRRPSAIDAGTLPRGLRLAQVIRGSTFLVERFRAAAPVAIRIDGRGRAFTTSNWRFLGEPAGARMGGL